MASRLPGVHTSRQSEGRGSGAAGAVVALVEPDKIEVLHVLQVNIPLLSYPLL